MLAKCVERKSQYRPKGAVQQAPGQKKEYPGYYWLAYDWNNLLFICTACNTKKRELFPLTDSKGRARSHHDDIHTSGLKQQRVAHYCL